MGTEIRTTTKDNPPPFLKLYKEAEGTLVAGKSSHKKVTIPFGVYEVVSASREETLTGSDYCWLLYTYRATIRSKKRPELCYEVEYDWGGDSRDEALGKLSESPLLSLEDIEKFKGNKDG